MESEIIGKIVELRKLGVSTAGLPESYRKEVAALATGGASVDELSSRSGVHRATIESWVKKYATPKKLRGEFKEVKVVDDVAESPNVRIKLEVRGVGGTTTLESTSKAEAIRFLTEFC